MPKVLDKLRTQKGIVREGIVNITASTYTVPVDAAGYPTVHTLRVYNACIITLPAIKDGVELHIIAKYASIAPDNPVILLLNNASTETILSKTSWALTILNESISILGDTNASPDDWGAI